MHIQERHSLESIHRKLEDRLASNKLRLNGGSFKFKHSMSTISTSSACLADISKGPPQCYCIINGRVANSQNNLLFSHSQEIVTALAGKKNIVPVTDNFMWLEPTSLPEDMRPILNFNGIK